jgi:cephalosporin-C deacetylase-like acetyl esterase
MTEGLGYTKEDVTYFSDGLKLAAHLYRPANWSPDDAPRPAVVCLTGYTGRKNIATVDIPRRLAREGYIALAPDYRGYGESEGTRGRHRPLEQAQDTYDSATYLKTVAGVNPNRIGIYGSSFGGANAIWAGAFDTRFKVVVSAVGCGNGEDWMEAVRTPEEWDTFRRRVAEHARDRVLTNTAELIYRYDIYPKDLNAVDKPTLTLEEHGSEDVTHLDLASVDALMRYKPDWVVDKISPRPVLFFIAEEDTIAPPKVTMDVYDKCGEPKRLITLPSARHNEVYEFSNSVHFETVASETVKWFETHL